MKKNLLVFGSTMVVLGLPVLFQLQLAAFDDDSFGLLLRLTARLAFLVFLLVFIARPLRQLSVSTMSKWLLKNRRYVGITFAAVMTVHLILLVALNGVQLVIPGIFAFLLIYLMLLTSFDKPAAALGPRRWRWLHKAGIYVIGGSFTLTIVSSVSEMPGNPIYLAMAALLLVSLTIRVGAFVKRDS